MRRILAIGLLAAAPLVTGGAVAHAAPSYDGNKAGNGITAQTMDCSGLGEVTLLTNSNHSSDMGGWGAARVQGDGVLIPTSFTFALVDGNTNQTLWDGSQSKGMGHARPTGQTLTCTMSNPAGATIGEVISDPSAPPVSLPSSVNPDDPAVFVFSATAVPRP